MKHELIFSVLMTIIVMAGTLAFNVAYHATTPSSHDEIKLRCEQTPSHDKSTITLLECNKI